MSCRFRDWFLTRCYYDKFDFHSSRPISNPIIPSSVHTRRKMKLLRNFYETSTQLTNTRQYHLPTTFACLFRTLLVTHSRPACARLAGLLFSSNFQKNFVCQLLAEVTHIIKSCTELPETPEDLPHIITKYTRTQHLPTATHLTRATPPPLPPPNQPPPPPPNPPLSPPPPKKLH